MVGGQPATVWIWLRRFEAEGVAGLEDRTSRPHRSPGQMVRLDLRRSQPANRRVYHHLVSGVAEGGAEVGAAATRAVEGWVGRGVSRGLQGLRFDDSRSSRVTEVGGSRRQSVRYLTGRVSRWRKSQQAEAVPPEEAARVRPRRVGRYSFALRPVRAIGAGGVVSARPTRTTCTSVIAMFLAAAAGTSTRSTFASRVRHAIFQAVVEEPRAAACRVLRAVDAEHLTTDMIRVVT